MAKTNSRTKLWGKRGFFTRDALKVKGSPQEWEEVTGIKGEKGDKGDPGAAGEAGNNGADATMTNIFIRNFIKS